MIDLKFELNDLTNKYDAKLNHTQIREKLNENFGVTEEYITPVSITEEDVLRVMPFIHILVNDTIDYLTIKMVYNKTGCNDNLCPKDIREKIVEIFKREKTILSTNFFEVLNRIKAEGDNNIPFYHFIFRIDFNNLEEEYLKLLDIETYGHGRDRDAYTELYMYPHAPGIMKYSSTLRYKTNYILGEDDYYYENLGKRNREIKIDLSEFNKTKETEE